MRDHSSGAGPRRSPHSAARLAVLLFALCAMALAVGACGGSKSSAGGSGGSSTSGGSSSTTSGGSGDTGAAADATPAQVQALLDAGFGPGTVKLSQLQPIAQQALKIAAKPVTPAESALIKKCLKTNGPCDLGHANGKLKLSETEDIDNPYFKSMRAIVLLEAIREPAIKSVTYTQASFKVPQALANFRSQVAQGADIIIGAFDLGPTMLPVVRQAAAKGITVVSNTQTIDTAKFDGSDLAFDVLANLCQYGTTMAKIAVQQGGKKVAMYTGPAGNAFAPKWQTCAKNTLKQMGATIVADGNTNWSPQGEQQAAAALAAKGLPDALIYDYTDEAFFNKFVSLGKTPPTQVGGAQDMGSFKAWKDAAAKGHAFKNYLADSEQIFGYVAVHAAIAKHEHAGDVPAHIVLPQPVLPAQKYARYYNPKFPAGASFGTGLPDDILAAAFSS